VKLLGIIIVDFDAIHRSSADQIFCIR